MKWLVAAASYFFRLSATFVLVTSLTCWLWLLTPGKYQDVLETDTAISLASNSQTFWQTYQSWVQAIPVTGFGNSQHWDSKVVILVGKSSLLTLALALGASAIAAVGAFLLGRLIFVPGFFLSQKIIQTALGLVAVIPTFLILLFALTFFGHFFLTLPSLEISTLLIKGFFAAVLCGIAGLPAFTHVWVCALMRFQSQPCFFTAKSQGGSAAHIYWRHAFSYAWKEASENLRQFFFLCCVGSVVVETSLGLPGIGKLAWDSWCYRDFPTVMGLAVFFFILHWVFDPGRDSCIASQ